MKPFLYDLIIKKRPWVLNLLSADVASLRDHHVESVTNTQIEPLATHFEEYVHRVLALPSDWIKLLGTSSYRARFWETVSSDPQFARIADILHYEYCSLLNFELAGRKVFFIEGPLLERLTLTIADAPSEFLRLPFKSFFFVIDWEPFLRLFPSLFRSCATTEEPLSCSITENEQSDGRHILFFVSNPDRHTLKHCVILKRGLLVRPGSTVEEALRTVWPDDYNTGESDERFFTEETVVFFRTLLNCVLYISSRTADWVLKRPSVPEPHDHPSRRQRAYLSRIRNQESRLDHFQIGEGITVAPFRKVAFSEGLPGVSRFFLKKFLVRGHWRTQHHGPQSGLTKLIFVEPYWKGPDIAETINKPYFVEM